MSYTKKLEEITSDIYRGIQFPGDYKTSRTPETTDRHVVRLLTATAISDKLLGATEGIIDDFSDLERLKDEKSYSRYYLLDGDLALTIRGKSLRITKLKILHDELVIPNGGLIIIRPKLPTSAPATPPYNSINFYSNQTFAYLSYLLRNPDLKNNPLQSPLFVGTLKSLEIPFYNNPLHSEASIFIETITRRAELLKELAALNKTLPDFDFIKPETPEERAARLKELKHIISA